MPLGRLVQAASNTSLFLFTPSGMIFRTEGGCVASTVHIQWCVVILHVLFVNACVEVKGHI